MKSQRFNSLALGAVLAGIGWALWWPNPVGEARAEVEVSSPGETRKQRPLLDSLRVAESDQEKFALAREVAQLPAGKIEELLDQYNSNPVIKENDFGVTAMLIAWGRIDPEAALDWAWRQSEGNGGKGRVSWYKAWNAVGPEWAISDSDSFIQFVARRLIKNRRGSMPGAPSLHFGRMELSWLSRAEPETFMKVCHNYGGWRSGAAGDFVESLTGIEKYESVLSTWEELSPEARKLSQDDVDHKRAKLEELAENDPALGRAQQEYDWAMMNMKHRGDPKENRIAQAVIQKWIVEDPEGFSQSRFVEWRKAKGK